MRQAGVIAAGAIYALDNNVERLKDDHTKARTFAEQVCQLPGFNIDLESVQSNIVIINVEKTGKTPGEILAVLRAMKVLLSEMSHNTIRAVMHLDVSAEQVGRAAEIIKTSFA